MNELKSVHSGLRRLRWLRSVVRLGSAWSVTLTAALWALAGAFALDYWIRMGRLERGVLLAAVLGAVAWVVARRLLPALRVREDDVTLALMVERRQGLSSDLVAAIQFADGRRDQYGSAALRGAVVECIAEAAETLDFVEGHSPRQLKRQAAALGVTLAAVVLPALLLPAYSGAFLSRLALGSAHYPTRTVIERIESPTGTAAAYGQGVEFRVRASGVLPGAGRVELRALSGNVTTTVELKPAGERGVYAGHLSRLLDDVEFAAYIGDAYTEPRVLRLIPLARVEIGLDVQPPAYAAERYRAEAAKKRQPPVPEGSAVGIVVTADKKLSAGTVAFDKQELPLRAEGGRLVLAAAGTPLEQVADAVRFKVQVRDADGLSLERPAAGMVEVLPDRPPKIVAAAVTRAVLPTAAPTVRWGALDDYALAKVVMHRTVHKADGNQPSDTVPVAELAGHPGQATESFKLDLAPLKLAKGDRVVVTLEATDWRGPAEGKSARSDALTFTVTDREGLLEAMEKLDDRMVEKLDQIIRAQLGIGE